MQQGSTEWLAWRKTKITASDAPIIMDLSPYRTAYELWCEKLDLIEPQKSNPYMQRGLDLEESAREEFENQTGIYTIPRVINHKKLDWFGASLDGMDLAEENIVEIKCNGPKIHSTVLMGNLPDHHYCQVQHQIEAAGLNYSYYFSYDGLKGFEIKIKRNQEFIDKMIEKEFEFWNCIRDFIPPKKTKRQKDITWLLNN